MWRFCFFNEYDFDIWDQTLVLNIGLGGKLGSRLVSDQSLASLHILH